MLLIATSSFEYDVAGSQSSMKLVVSTYVSVAFVPGCEGEDRAPQPVAAAASSSVSAHATATRTGDRDRSAQRCAPAPRCRPTGMAAMLCGLPQVHHQGDPLYGRLVEEDRTALVGPQRHRVLDARTGTVEARAERDDAG